MDLINKIAQINNIKQKLNPSKSGFNGNRVFLSDDYVIKIFENKDIEYYDNELLIYKNIDMPYISKLINFGVVDDTNYILLLKIKARPLYSIWESLDSNINENIGKINDAELAFIIYKDNHFDNFLFDGKKVYAIDFEDLIMAPLDYQLDTWCRMSKYPHLFANKEDEKEIKIESYSNLIVLLEKYYPRMFEYQNLKIRLQIYSLIYDLRIMVKHLLTEEQMLDRLNEDLGKTDFI